jgi:RNA polymerase sigma-70 factor (ECF subfamily)
MPGREPLSQLFGSTSSSLIDRIRARDADAWRRFVGLYGPSVFHWCARFGLSGDDSADVSQEVFRSVAISVSEFRHDRPGDSFRGWLYTLTRNKIRDFARQRAQREATVGGSAYQALLQQIPAQQELHPAESSNSVDANLLRRALDVIRAEFEPRSWQAFWRTTVDDQNATQVAEELGMSPTAVRKAKSRVLRRLREMLIDPLVY